MSRTRLAVVSATAFAGLAVLAACSNGSDPYQQAAPQQQPVQQSTQIPQAPQSSQAPARNAGLNATDVGNLGKVVTSADGRTLYRFDKDTAKPSASRCDGTCAQQWPPVLVESGLPTVEGINQGLVGSVTRADGTKQVTLNGWPLYRFAKDTAAGQANGQGVGGTWFAATPEGKKAAVQAPAAPASSANSSNSGGYGY